MSSPARRQGDSTHTLLSGQRTASSGKYVSYEQPDEVSRLDIRKRGNRHVLTFPFGLYGGDVPEHSYTIDASRRHHADHFSRFGYDNALNGYGVGITTVGYNHHRLYKTPEPKGVAPARFYNTNEPDYCMPHRK